MEGCVVLMMKFTCSRRRQRGAVFVESVIVIAVLTLMFAGVVFFQHLYVAKIGAQAAARDRAWQLALDGCNPELPIVPLLHAVALDQDGAEATNTSAPVETFFTIGHEVGAQSGSSRAPALLGGHNYRLDSSIQLACNETMASPRGDVLDLIFYGVRNLLPLPGSGPGAP